jgi:two-component system sensor histidine kinase PilS (NtrC family)
MPSAAEPLRARGPAPASGALAGLWPAVGETHRTSLRFLALARLVVVALLLTFVLVTDGDRGNALIAERDHFLAVGVAYFGAAVAFLVAMPRLRRWFHAQLSLHLAVDLLMLTLLMNFAGGVRSGFGVLLVSAVIGTAVLSVPRLAVFHAALASLLLLGEQALRSLNEPVFDSAPLVQAGLIGLAGIALSAMVSLLGARLAAQEALARRRGADLRSQVAINRLVIAEISQGVIVLDADGRVRTMNPTARQMVDGAQAPDALERLAQARLAPDGKREVEIGAPGADHRVRVRHLLPDSDERSGASVLLVEDLHEVQERARQLKLAAMGRLSASIAHEIRNPLAAIRHANGLLAERLSDPLGQRLARMVEDNSVRIDRIVEDVLAIARRGRGPVTDSVAPGAFLPSLLAELEAGGQVPAGRVALEITAEDPIRFDPSQLRQVLVNLLVNAVRYASSEPGAIALIWQRGADHRLELCVSDDGPGLSDDMLQHAFEPFFTSEARGSGLGLYLVREFCEGNAASVRFERREREAPRGSVFVIRPTS